jgi:hypothetical protein
MDTIMLPFVQFEGLPVFRVVTNRRTIFVRAKSKQDIKDNGVKFLASDEWITSIWENTPVIDLA